MVGDCPDDSSARTVAAAMVRYRKRGGFPTWTYTHAWRTVRRASWGQADVLASCESVKAVKQAQRRGYATALVVERFSTDKAHDIDGVRVVPCPNQTRGITCDSCRLCADADRLKSAGLTIGFALHGKMAQHHAAKHPGRIALTIA